jgi:deoxyribonuclease IV
VLIGAHCGGGIKGALDKAVEIEADAVQLFTQSPRTWRAPAPNPEAWQRFKERRVELEIEAVLCHALYLVNLAAPNDDFYEKSVTSMRATMEIACGIEANGVVFHVGSHMGAGFDVGLERAVPALEQVLELCSDTTWLLMENSAGAGGTIGRSVDELAILYERLGGHRRLGICLDSCHLFASGYDITTDRGLESVLEELDASIGLDRLRAVHVNDSAAPLGSNRDRHANVGEGLMGDRLGLFVSHPKLQHLPAVLEVPGSKGRGPDTEDVRKLRDLHARWLRGN